MGSIRGNSFHLSKLHAFFEERQNVALMMHNTSVSACLVGFSMIPMDGGGAAAEMTIEFPFLHSTGACISTGSCNSTGV